MALNESKLVDILHTLLNSVSSSIRTEAEVLNVRGQINSLVEEAEQDVKDDVAAVAAQ